MSQQDAPIPVTGPVTAIVGPVWLGLFPPKTTEWNGEARVRAASRSLLARKFAHASDLRTAIDAAIGIRPERPPLRVVSARPECDNCLGSGMVSPPGSNIATRCPECNPHPAPVAEGAQP